MKFLLIFVIIFCLSSCQENAQKATKTKGEEPYFNQIFNDSSCIFNGYNLGDKLSKDLYQLDSLSNKDYYNIYLETNEEKIKSIQLEMIVFNETTALELIDKIVEKYNKYLNNKKTPSKFISWSYNANKNYPAEIILIYEKELGTITLDISYKAQR